MPYDPNCAETKAALKKAVDDAVAKREEELREEHEAEVEGLKKKRDELQRKLTAAKAGENDPEEVTRLEGQLEEAQKHLREANKRADKAERDAKAATERADKEEAVSRKLLVEGGLTAELNAGNVGSAFTPAVTALLAPQVTVKEVDGERKAFVGDKPLGEFVKAWAQGDQGKHYVVPPTSSGAGGGQQTAPSGGSAKKLSEMTEAERVEFYNRDPEGFRKASEQQA